MWRPQVALFVNATTFLPVFMPLAPSATVIRRFPAAMAGVLEALSIDPGVAETERVEMGAVALAKTASRPVLGVMTEFTSMAEHTIRPAVRIPPIFQRNVGHSASAHSAGAADVESRALEWWLW